MLVMATRITQLIKFYPFPSDYYRFDIDQIDKLERLDETRNATIEALCADYLNSPRVTDEVQKAITSLRVSQQFVAFRVFLIDLFRRVQQLVSPPGPSTPLNTTAPGPLPK